LGVAIGVGNAPETGIVVAAVIGWGDGKTT
jgi:hypothetical protein